GIALKTSTENTGHYVFSALPPGKYSLELKKDGFQTIFASDVELHVNDRQELNFDLSVGTVSDTVTVTGSTPLVNTVDGAVSTVVDRQFVDSLPMNGRTFQPLIAMTPGVVFTPASGSNAGQFVVNGQRSDDNYFTIDGVSATNGNINSVILYQSGGGQLPSLSALGGTNSMVSMDAMQEFRIQTSSFAPEFGRTPGGQIGIVTRSGTNQFHGTAFEYFRNDVLNANDWFGNANALPRAKERQNDFGGVLGGPIRRNRTFFFFSYEGQRLRQPVTFTTTVPSVATRQAAPVSIQPFLNAFPIPNGATLAGGVGVFAAAVSNPSNLDATSFRIDQRLGDKLVLFGRYNYSPSDTSNSGLAAFPVSVSSSYYKATTVTAGLTATVSPRILNELRLNYAKSTGSGAVSLTTLGGAVPLSDSAVFPAGVTSANGYMTVVIPGIGGSGGAGGILYGASPINYIPQFNVTDSVSVTQGAHQIKFGVDYRRLTPQAIPMPYWVSASFTGLTATPGGVLSGVAASAGVIASSGGTLLTRNFSFFGQDAWRVSRRLTLTYGLRWDINPPAKGLDADSALYPLQNIGSASTVSLGTRGENLYPMRWNNIAPRIGVSYQVRQNPRWGTVLRGGVGVFYNSSIGTIGSAIGNGFPFAATNNYALVPYPLAPALAAAPVITGATPISAAFYGADPNLTTPRTWQWNASVEQALGQSQSLTVSYIGAVGRDLYRKFRYNNPNAIFKSSVYITGNSGSSDYHSLQTKFQRRLSQGLQVLASWTWSHSIDTASDDQTFTYTPTNVAGASIDRGSSDYDARHVVSAAVSYRIPSPFNSGFGKTLLGGW
ncbi:MAG: carboxypeptidase regulatory-like domain-containing protein, partial [Bryobacteraceae bacterium]